MAVFSNEKIISIGYDHRCCVPHVSIEADVLCNVDETHYFPSCVSYN